MKMQNAKLFISRQSTITITLAIHFHPPPSFLVFHKNMKSDAKRRVKFLTLVFLCGSPSELLSSSMETIDK